jgi:SseB protein N-terminal domain
MTETTPLDTAHAAMIAAPDDDSARLRFYERLADSELFLLLSQEAEGDQIQPEMFEVADGSFVLAFDSQDRLTSFAERAAPYAAMSGRVIAQLLAGQGIGLGLNLNIAPSSFLVASEAVDWLQQTLGHAPNQVEAKLSAFHRPAGLPETLITALDAKLATATGLASSAYLVGVEYDNGARGHLLGFVDAVENAQNALAKAVNEALTFSGIEAGALDVGFFAASDPVSAKLAKSGLRFDLPEPPVQKKAQPVIPGSDPNKPPILK